MLAEIFFLRLETSLRGFGRNNPSKESRVCSAPCTAVPSFRERSTREKHLGQSASLAGMRNLREKPAYIKVFQPRSCKPLRRRPTGHGSCRPEGQRSDLNLASRRARSPRAGPHRTRQNGPLLPGPSGPRGGKHHEPAGKHFSAE
jgi:hypothetical protein